MSPPQSGDPASETSRTDSAVVPPPPYMSQPPAGVASSPHAHHQAYYNGYHMSGPPRSGSFEMQRPAYPPPPKEHYERSPHYPYDRASASADRYDPYRRPPGPHYPYDVPPPPPPPGSTEVYLTSSQSADSQGSSPARPPPYPPAPPGITRTNGYSREHHGYPPFDARYHPADGRYPPPHPYPGAARPPAYRVPPHMHPPPHMSPHRPSEYPYRYDPMRRQPPEAHYDGRPPPSQEAATAGGASVPPPAEPAYRMPPPPRDSPQRRPGSPSQIETTRREEATNMGCTCKRSKCLKLYCMCFGASVMCGRNCRCQICYNTPEHDQSRREAVRTILSRNPSAFDTKFKKTADSMTPTSVDRGLTHKLGCKCRRSACTKKYCECYNAGVKCSANCRCMGCRNMPPGTFGQFGPESVTEPPSLAHAQAVHENHVSDVGVAESLAFLKHSTPEKASQKESREMNQAPSLASSETSPMSDRETAASDMRATDDLDDEEEEDKDIESSEAGVVNALMMAAYAMTTLQNPSPSKKPVDGPPPTRPFRTSPKRKLCEETNDTNEEKYVTVSSESWGSTSSRSDPTRADGRDNNAQIVGLSRDASSRKRIRMGSTKTTVGIRSARTGQVDRDNKKRGAGPPRKPKNGAAMGGNTPTTPVSSRCIDFRQMAVKELDEQREEHNEGDKNKADTLPVVAT